MATLTSEPARRDRRRAGWRLTYIGRLMTHHGATLTDAQVKYADLEQDGHVCFDDEATEVADQEGKLFGFLWTNWTPRRAATLGSSN